MSKGNFSKVTYWPSARRQVANQPGKKIKGLRFRKSSAINTQSTLFFIIPYNLFFPLSLLLGSLRNGHVTLHCADRFLWKSGYFKRFSWWDYTYVQAPGNQPWSWCALIEIHMDRTWGTGYFRDVDILHFGHWKKNGKLSLPLAPNMVPFGICTPSFLIVLIHIQGLRSFYLPKMAGPLFQSFSRSPHQFCISMYSYFHMITRLQ